MLNITYLKKNTKDYWLYISYIITLKRQEIVFIKTV